MQAFSLAFVLVAFSLVSAPTAQARPINKAQASSERYTNTMCHQKIDPKHLAGAALKAAWKDCRANTDTYN